MKNIIYSCILLCIVICGCSPLDLSDVGYKESDRLKSSEVKNLLYNTSDGCWTSDYQGHEFYFQFHTDGTVTLDSEFLEMAVTGKTTFATSGKSVSLNIENCDVHFRKLGNEYAETKFIISEIPNQEEDIVLILNGVTTGNTIELRPTTLDEIQLKTASKSDFNELFEKNLLDNQVICDSEGNLIGYYGLVLSSIDDLSIKVLTLEDKTGSDTKGHVQYYESKLVKDGKIFRLENPISEIKSINGETYALKSIDCSGDVVSVDGMSGLVLTSNKNAVDDFDYTSGRKYSMCQYKGTGDACDEIWNETSATLNGIPYEEIHLEDIAVMQYDKIESGQRPLVIWRDWYKNIVFPGSENGASILMNSEDSDRILFKNISGSGLYEQMGMMGYDSTAEECAKIQQALSNLLSTWFNENGLFVVRYQTGYFYLLCPDVEATPQGGMWIKLEETN